MSLDLLDAVADQTVDGLLGHLSARSRRDFVSFGFAPIRPLSVHDISHPVQDWARRQPEVTAVVDADGRRLSYADLDRRATQVANLLSERGVQAGDRVGIFLSRGLEMVVGILGVLKAGAAWVPQDIRHARAASMQHIVRVADLQVVLTTSAHRAAVPDGVPHVVDLDRLPDPQAPAERYSMPTQDHLTRRRVHREHPVDHLSQADRVAVVIFTSGTTGTPNGVEVTHANLVNTILNGPAALGIAPGMRVAQLLNIAFDMAVWEIFGALTHGATLVIRGRDIQACAAQSDVLIATPSVLSRIDPQACPTVRIVAVAGERCPQALADAWSSRASFHNSCGPTEVSIVNTVHRLCAGEQLTIGAPIPNTTVYVLDESLRPVETGEVGEMWAGGMCVTRGYLGNPELTAERYRHDPFTGGLMFRTRDLVSWTPQGQLLHHGRTDDLVKVRGGFRVELDAVTSAMEHSPSVALATTLCVDGVLIGVLVPTADAGSSEQLINAARESVAHRHAYYYVPERFLVVDELPLTDRGKVDRRALLARLERVAA